jgi:hypothetical protein
MLRYSTWTLALGAFLLFACGGDDDGNSGDGDGADIDGGGGADDPDGGGSADDPDAAPGTGTIECGDDTCDAETQECCVGEGGAASCVEVDACETPSFTCDGPEDCGDQVCCADDSGGEGGTACMDQGSCGGSVVCQDADDCEDGEECCEPSDQEMTPVGGFCAANCPGPPG